MDFGSDGIKQRIVVFAHRGASGHAPENTLSTFHLAQGMGKVVHCWTINHSSAMEMLYVLEVDGIMSDNPDLVLRAQDA
jgi:glycerophosphoryl diester phosphodiesterase